jgi:hypothetical protein
MVVGRYLVISTGTEIDAAKPCPKCRPNAQWESVDGLAGVEYHEEFVLRMARDVTPGGARDILAKVDAGKVKLPDAVVSILVERAGAVEPKQPEPAGVEASAPDRPGPDEVQEVSDVAH